MRRVDAVSPTDSLEPTLRKTVTAAYKSAMSEVGEEEFFYVGRNIDRKVSAVSASRIPWVRELAQEMEILHELYGSHTAGELDLDEGAIRAIGAALFYFVNPFDLVPDHLPGKGYLDDAQVLHLCVDYLRKHAPDCVQ